MILIRKTSLALVLVANLFPASAKAATWVSVVSGISPSDGQHRTYQVDVSSITKYGGWTYANKRICLDYMNDCRRVLETKAQCKEGKFEIYTRKNGDEWWTSFHINYGTRYKFYSQEHRAESISTAPRRDARKTREFNFLCKGIIE